MSYILHRPSTSQSGPTCQGTLHWISSLPENPSHQRRQGQVAPLSLPAPSQYLWVGRRLVLQGRAHAQRPSIRTLPSVFAWQLSSLCTLLVVLAWQLPSLRAPLFASAWPPAPMRASSAWPSTFKLLLALRGFVAMLHNRDEKSKHAKPSAVEKNAIETEMRQAAKWTVQSMWTSHQQRLWVLQIPT